MNNEILTDELAQMNEQIKKMKEILSRQSIVNETLIKNVTRTRIKQLRSSDHAKAVMGVVGIASLLMLHYGMHLSLAFTILTMIYLGTAVALSLYMSYRLKTRMQNHEDMVTVRRRMVQTKKFQVQWLFFSIPFTIAWLVWFYFELCAALGPEVEFVLMGGVVGGVLGSIFGVRTFIKDRKILKESIADLDEFLGEK